MADVRRHPGFARVLERLGPVIYWREYGWPTFCRPVGTDGVSCE
jgi:hypothetical protein